MCTHYVDIRLLPDPEFIQAHLLAALYSKLHRALVQIGANDIGVSFPQYDQRRRSLGCILRLHGSETALGELLMADWLRGMRDHTELGRLGLIPTEVVHRRLQRRQFKTNVDRLRRRRMRRKGETYHQAVAAIPDSVQHQPDLPYMQIRSNSTSHSFCMFLELGDPEPQAIDGVFNSYGLSRTATLPWF